MTSTQDLAAVSPGRVAMTITYNLGLVDIFAAQLLQTEHGVALSVSPLTRRLMLNALMHYRRALEGDNEDIGVPIIDAKDAVHPLLDDHLRERAHYLKGEMLAQQSRDQGRALGRSERQKEIDKLQERTEHLEGVIGRRENGEKKKRARAKR